MNYFNQAAVVALGITILLPIYLLGGDVAQMSALLSLVTAYITHLHVASSFNQWRSRMDEWIAVSFFVLSLISGAVAVIAYIIGA